MKPRAHSIIALIIFIYVCSFIIVGTAHSTWNIETSPITWTLNDIWGASESDIYAVGDQETILHNDGTGWSIVSSLGNGAPFRDVSGNSGSNIYAVGDDGVVKYFDGNDWTDPTNFINTSADLNGVWVSTGGEVFIVGGTPPTGGTAVIFHYTGSDWEPMESSTGNILEAVWGSSATDVFAVGASGTILHYDGFEWLSMNSNTNDDLTCVWGSSGSDVFAGGSSTSIYHYDGNNWIDPVNDGSVQYPNDLWGSSDSNVYAVGGNDAGEIDHFDGSTWRLQYPLANNFPNGVWGSAKDNVFVVGNTGMIMRYTDSSGGLSTSPDPPTADDPPDEAIFGAGVPVTLDTSDFNDPDGDAHDQTHWELRRADSGMLLPGYPVTMTQDPGLTVHDITSLMDGLKYDWQVGYADSDGNESWSREYSFKVGDPKDETLPPVLPGADVGDFGMISIVHWPDNPSAEKVFNIDYDRRNYIIGTYDAGKNRYIEFGNDLEMEPGRSYWILAREGLTINFSGIPVSLADMYVALDFNTNTGNGWNMVAPPNEADYYWTNVQVVEEVDGALIFRGTVQSLADTNPYIDRRLWRWENGHYHSDTPETDTSQVMAFYKGYWIKARQANVLLLFEPGARIASLGRSEILMARIWKKTTTWLSNLNIFSKEAVAEGDDTPPMPMGGLDDDTVDPLFQGCFIEAISHKL